MRQFSIDMTLVWHIGWTGSFRQLVNSIFFVLIFLEDDDEGRKDNNTA